MRIAGGTEHLNTASIAAGEGRAPRPRPTQRETLLRRMRILAKTRFNAQRRLEAKASATNFGLQIANLYTIAIGILLIQFPSSEVLKPASGALNYVSLLASVFVQIMALIESLKDYSGKAKAMRDCGLQVSALYQALELDPRGDWEVLRQYDSAYQRILQDTDVNHDDIDYQKWQIDESRKRTQSLEAWIQHVGWRIAYIWNVYALTTVILVSPGFVLWAILAGGVG
jgi:hypothetical protein